MRTRIATALCIAIVLVGAAACSSSESSSNNTTTTANRGFEVTTPAGQVSISLSGSLPPNWPSGFPLPSGTEPAGSGSLGNSSQTGFIGVFSTSESPQDAYNFYASNPELSTADQSAIGSGNAYVGYMTFSGEFSGWLATLPRDNETLIVVYLNESTTGTTAAGSGTTIAS